MADSQEPPEFPTGSELSPEDYDAVKSSPYVPSNDLGLDLTHFPHINSFKTSDTAPYSSPVSGPYPDHETVYFSHQKDVKDEDAIQGSCGLYNMGNTCFMNAGLQCLFSNTQLVTFFLHHFKTDDGVSPTGKFAELLHKVWTGQYSLIYPVEFKDMLGLYHPQFNDYRQHDCQEFLALVLDSFHEQLNMSQDAKSLDSPDISSPTAGNGPIEETLSDTQSDKASTLINLSDANSSGDVDSSSSATLKSQQSTSSESDFTPSSSGSCSLQTTASEASLPGMLLLQDCMNDDSNMSVPSEHSLDATGMPAVETHRCVPLPSDVKPFGSPCTPPADVEMDGDDAAADLSKDGVPETTPSMRGNANNVISAMNKCMKCDVEMNVDTGITDTEEVLSDTERRLPSIDDLYNKDSKILNTNVLATEFLQEEVALDSVKFHKEENTGTVTSDDSDSVERQFHLEQLQDLLPYEATKDSACNMAAIYKPIKETNLLANLRDKFTGSDDDDDCYSNKKLIFASMKNKPLTKTALDKDVYSINNIKRLKLDHDVEKNMKMQAKLKVNHDINLTKLSPGEAEPNNCCASPGTNFSSSLFTLEPSFSNNIQDNENFQDNRQLPCRGANNSVVTLNNEEQWQSRYSEKAELSWSKYLGKNQSIIVDTFQGQFKSTVVCSECHHMSVTFEPFMYLSVPLPRAMERQICVIYISCDGKPATRYLLTVNKQDSLCTLKRHLLDMAGDDSGCEIIVVEVLDNHIARILDNNSQLKFVNDTARTLYAFEMTAAPPIDDMSTSVGDIITPMNDVIEVAPNNMVQMPTCTTSSSTLGASVPNTALGACVPSNTVVTCAPVHTSTSAGDDSSTAAVTVESGSGTAQLPPYYCSTSQGPEFLSPATLSSLNRITTPSGDIILNNISDPLGLNQHHSWAPPSCDNFRSGVNWTQNPLGGTDTSMDEDYDTVGSPPPKSNVSQDCTTQPHIDLESPSNSLPQEMNSEIDSHAGAENGGGDACVAAIDSGGAAGCGGGVEQWRSCAICLEELADAELLVHADCGGTLCHACLEISFKHYGDGAFICPVCQGAISPGCDFIQLNSMVDYKPKTRMLSVPVVHRYTQTDTSSSPEPVLFGHPSLLYLPSQMPGEYLYENIDRVAACSSIYTVLLTDGQGLRCSRCMYTDRCSGCPVAKDVSVSLQPGDHLTIHYSEPLTESQLMGASVIQDHSSMAQQRPDNPLTLTDCFEAFTEREVLDEHNPWYCPHCHCNRCANKTMTVWRYPQTLVVYLKRFVFHELLSTKIDNKVVFPLDNLDLSHFVSGPCTDALNFDLHGCICHFGGVNSGHYTVYTKHPATHTWTYYNDENTTRQQPREEDYSSAYILFYQRQGTGSAFTVPQLQTFQDATSVPAASGPEPVMEAAMDTMPELEPETGCYHDDNSIKTDKEGSTMTAVTESDANHLEFYS